MKQISKLTNSEIGSVHWFNTIMGNILHTGEYLMNHGIEKDGLTDYMVKKWGKQLYEEAQEMIDSAEMWRESAYISKQKIIDSLKQTIEKLEKQ